MSARCGCGFTRLCVKAPAGAAGACERPRWSLCTGCGDRVGVQCQSGSRAKCAHCSAMKHGDLAAVARSGFVMDDGSQVGLLTLTAPGADALPWDTELCGHLEDGSECSGKSGCKVQAVPLALWHASLARRWSWFVTYLRRYLPECDVQFLKVYERQHRDALHVHACVRIVGPCTPRRFRAAVRLCALRWGFGRQFDWSPVSSDRSAARAGGYVAKYCTKGYDTLGDVPMLNLVTGELRCGALRVWSASSRWGDSMRVCRARRLAWWAAKGGGGANPAQPAAVGGLDLYSNCSTSGDGSEALPHSTAGACAM